MEEKINLPEGFFDLDKLLVDREVGDPFREEAVAGEIHHYPYEDARSRGYIRYVLRGKRMIILDCLVVELK